MEHASEESNEATEQPAPSRAGSNWCRGVFAEKVSLQRVARLRPLGRQTRRHSAAQIKKLCASLTAYSWVNPILIDDEFRVIAGLGRLEAARRLGWEEAPCLIVSLLTDAEKRAYALADNRIGELSEWDDEACAAEFVELANLDIEVDLAATGFDLAEVEAMMREEAPAPAPDLPPVWSRI